MGLIKLILVEFWFFEAKFGASWANETRIGGGGWMVGKYAHSLLLNEPSEMKTRWANIKKIPSDIQTTFDVWLFVYMMDAHVCVIGGNERGRICFNFPGMDSTAPLIIDEIVHWTIALLFGIFLPDLNSTFFVTYSVEIQPNDQNVSKILGIVFH